MSPVPLPRAPMDTQGERRRLEMRRVAPKHDCPKLRLGQPPATLCGSHTRVRGGPAPQHPQRGCGGGIARPTPPPNTHTPRSGGSKPTDTPVARREDDPHTSLARGDRPPLNQRGSQTPTALRTRGADLPSHTPLGTHAPTDLRGV